MKNAALEKLDAEILHIAPFAKDFTNVTFTALREILLADLAWKESIERRLAELEKGDPYHRPLNNPPSLAKPSDKFCPYCGMDTKIANPSGKCSHIYYPDDVNTSLKPSVPDDEMYQSKCNQCGLFFKHNDPLRLSCFNCTTQESVAVEKPKYSCLCGGCKMPVPMCICTTVEDKMCQNTNDGCHTPDCGCEGHDAIWIPRSVAQDVIDKGYELPNELYDAIQQSLKERV